jgi:hypothetical protein
MKADTLMRHHAGVGPLIEPSSLNRILEKGVVGDSVKGHMTAAGLNVHIHVYRDILRTVHAPLSFHYCESSRSFNAADAERVLTHQTQR